MTTKLANKEERIHMSMSKAQRVVNEYVKRCSVVNNCDKCPAKKMCICLYDTTTGESFKGKKYLKPWVEQFNAMLLKYNVHGNPQLDDDIDVLETKYKDQPVILIQMADTILLVPNRRAMDDAVNSTCKS